MSDAEDEVLEEEEQETEEPQSGANPDVTLDPDDNEEEEKDKEEEGAEEPEPEEELPHVPITEQMLKEGLSLLCKTGNGLAHAFVKLEIKEKELTDISPVQSFIHLRYVDFSQNALRDISPLAALTHLLSLRLDQNQLLNVAGLGELPYLQIASLAQNRIQTLQGLALPRLESLNLIGNELRTVDSLDCSKLCSLHTLELRGNQLQSTAGLNLPNLRELYLAQNNIKSLEGLEYLVHLTSLHLRDNQLEILDGFSEKMQALQYLNIRGNLVSNLLEIPKLQCLPMLRALVLRENPCDEEEGYRMEVLIALPNLQRLDKEFFEEEERMEAAETLKTRLEEKMEESMTE